MHDLRRVSDHHCLHYILLHLNEGWRGLHVMVVMYLRKYWAPKKRLTACLMTTYSPGGSAQIAGLLRKRHQASRHLVVVAGTE